MKILTAGCSFTYGEELRDPKISSWPAILGKRLGVQVNNIARPSASNEEILRTVMSSIGADIPDLLIVGWSSFERIELADEFGPYTFWPGCKLKLLPDGQEFVGSKGNTHRSIVTDYYSKHHNVSWAFKRWIQQVIYLQNLCMVKDIPYLMFNTFNNQQQSKQQLRHCQDLLPLLDTNNFVGWPNIGVDEWIFGMNRMPKGHPTIDGHKKIEEIIYDALVTRGIIKKLDS